MVHYNKDPAGPNVEIQCVWKPQPGTEATMVSAEITAASGDRIYAWALELSTIENIVITPQKVPPGVFVTKYIVNKGTKDNYASVWIYTATDAELSRSTSIDLDVFALGEG